MAQGRGARGLVGHLGGIQHRGNDGLQLLCRLLRLAPRLDVRLLGRTKVGLGRPQLFDQLFIDRLLANGLLEFVRQSLGLVGIRLRIGDGL